MQNRKVLLAVAVVLLVTLVFGGACQFRGQSGDLHFTLIFKDAKQLRPGQFLVYKGMRIGKVQNVDLDPSGSVRVQIQVSSKYRDLVHQEAAFVIEKPTIADISGEHQVTMSDSVSKGTPIVEGSVLQGSEGWLSDLAGNAKDAIARAAEGVRDAISKSTKRR
jgi:hypothetical protein